MWGIVEASEVGRISKMRNQLSWGLAVGGVGLRNKSSRPEVFCKEDVLKNFAKFGAKHQCQSLFF